MQSFQGKDISGLDTDTASLSLRKQGSICLPCLDRWRVPAFPVVAMVDERSNRNSLRQLWRPACVVDMKVREENVVYLRQPCLARSSHNSIGVPAFIARPSCIDQQRLALRRNKQRCLAAFDVHKVDLQRFPGSRRPVRALRGSDAND